MTERLWEKRTYCGRLVSGDAGKEVVLVGWVDAIRDHSQIVFIHLRDISGTVQVVFDHPGTGNHSGEAESLKEEYVVEVRGSVELRAAGTENPNLETGTIEVRATDLTILSRAQKLPFQISEKAMVFGEVLKANPDNVDEDLRLQYRYLDLRRPSVQNHFRMRHRIVKAIRDYLDDLDFLELETPVLTKSTPEGARDYLVPSRIHQGQFYALPQSPQLFKQLFMISGMDRYYQVVKCFRDEDLRPNRQPEFTQLDLEASFIDEEFIYQTLEGLIQKIFALGGIDLQIPFPRMTYDEAMARYGSDRPDLRYGMAFVEVTAVFKNTKYSIFQRIVRKKGIVKGFCIKGQAQALSKNVLQNEYSLKVAPSFGAQGMSWMKMANGKLESNIVQFFSDEEQNSLIRQMGAEDGDVIILIADQSPARVNKVLNKLRQHFAARLDLIPADRFCPVWITGFPLFELDDGRLSAVHHPFTMPDHVDFDPTNREALLSLKSRAYDIVMNGEELGGGSIRIHQAPLQEKIFKAIGLTREEADAKFGFLLRALDYGAPPHGGLALGLDRVVAMILQLPSIRDVIAFPKNRSAVCPLTEAPSPVASAQLEELGLTPELISKHVWLEAKPGEAHDGQQKEKITRGQVEHVAALARLSLAGSEVEGYQKDLNAILAYVEMLEELDTGDIAPMQHVLDIKNVWRKDAAGNSGMAAEIVSGGPEQKDGYFKVPKILQD